MKKNSREIRGFKSGRFPAKDGTAILSISRSDDFIDIEVADLESEGVYSFRIPFDAEFGDEVSFKHSLLEDTQREDLI